MTSGGESNCSRASRGFLRCRGRRPQLREVGESFKGNIPSRVSVVILASPNEVETGSVLL